MAKASDNIFPKIIESMNTSDPAAPSDSSWKLYAKAPGIYARSSNAIVGPFAAGISDPMTTRGDIIVRNSSNVTARLAIGTSGKVLSSDGTDVSWQTAGAGAMTRIQQIVSTGSSTETFSAIAGTYETLVIHWNGRSDRAANNWDNMGIRFNGDTGANYSSEEMGAFNTTTTSVQSLNATSVLVGQLLAASADANAASSGSITIPGYARTVFQKSFQAVYGGFPATTVGQTVVISGRWKSTAAITSVTLFPLSNFISGTVFTLYGIT